MRKNPKVPELRFEAGFWSLKGNADPFFHVTLHLEKILDAGALKPRYLHGKGDVQSLGGQHDVSLSFYNNIVSAKNTLLYLYRMWQWVNGLLTDSDLINKFGASQDLLTKITKFGHRDTAKDFFRLLSVDFVINDPSVLGNLDNHLKDLDIRNLALIVVKNPTKYVFMNEIWSRGECLIDIESFPSIINAINHSRPFSYLDGRSTLDNSFYDLVRTNLKVYENTKLDLNVCQYSDLRSYSSPQKWCDILFGYGSYYDLPKESDTVIKFGDLKFDLSPKEFYISDICEYSRYEDEIRVFQEISTASFLEIISVEDVLREATALNNGIEPLFWSMDFTPTSSYNISSFKFINSSVGFTSSYIVQEVETFDTAFDYDNMIHASIFLALYATWRYDESSWTLPLFSERDPRYSNFKSTSFYGEIPKTFPQLSEFNISFEMIDTYDNYLNEHKLFDFDWFELRGAIYTAKRFNRLTKGTPLVFVKTKTYEGLASGIELLRLAKELNQKTVPVIILTQK
jgi:hypothetical protein